MPRSTQCQDMTICWWAGKKGRPMPHALGRTHLLTPPIRRARSLHLAQAIPTEMPSLTGVGDKGGGRQHYLQGLQLSFSPFCMSFSKCCPKRLQAPNPEGSSWLGSSKMSEGIRALHSQWELAGESDLGFLSRSSSEQEGEVGWRGASGTPATAPVIHKELPGVLRVLPCHRHRPMMK